MICITYANAIFTPRPCKYIDHIVNSVMSHTIGSPIPQNKKTTPMLIKLWSHACIYIYCVPWRNLATKQQCKNSFFCNVNTHFF